MRYWDEFSSAATIRRSPRRRVAALLLATAPLLAPSVSGAQQVSSGQRRTAEAFAPWYQSGVWSLRTSVYTRHFNPQTDHVNEQRLVNVEYRRQDNWLGGLASFRNSFGQPTQYAYIGYQWQPWNALPSAYLKLTGGIIHGYKGKYKDKIPLNKFHYAPAILPSIGFNYGRLESELIVFGTAGLMVTMGWRFD